MNAYIVDAVRTPRGRGNDKGSLKTIRPIDLMGQTLRALATRTGLDSSKVADTLIGCVTQTADQGSNIGKLSVIAAGWSDRAPGMSVNRYCASGLSAVNYAALKAVQEDGIAVGGGVEMMSRVPVASDKGPLTHDFPFQQQAVLLPIGIAAVKFSGSPSVMTRLSSRRTPPKPRCWPAASQFTQSRYWARRFGSLSRAGMK